MAKEEFLAKFKWKDYNNELETILEKKDFSSDVKNLLLSMFYKMENGYADYAKTKMDVLSKQEMMEEIIQDVKEHCNKIELLTPLLKEGENSDKKSVHYKIKKKEGYIEVFPNEKDLLKAIYAISERVIYVPEKYKTVEKAIQEFLNKGHIADSFECMRDFNGWSWYTAYQEIEQVSYNLIYQNIRILTNSEILNDWINHKEDIDYVEKLREKLKGNFPKMDGSTSTIPLEAGIVAAFEGISQEEAEAKIKHSTTYGSFENLLEGKCELVFVPLLSDEQKKAAADKGIELEIVPITKEAFVFVINPDNTVDTLTQEQIRKIYTGEIKNWKELGGDDAEIVAYQRDETSGSQNNMKVFMKGYNLIKAKQEFILESMNSILDVIAGYDNGKYSIGYSVHAYARNMYNLAGIKFVKVDGVEPSYKTIEDGTYPLIDYKYAIFNKKEAEGSNVRNMVEWLLTSEGQKAMSNAGYVPVKATK